MRTIIAIAPLLCVLLGATFLSACALDTARPRGLTLFEQLGGLPKIETITERLLDRVFNDDRIAFLFENAERDDLHRNIVAQICMETGGSCIYEGRDMVEVHGGMEITYAEFDIFVEDLILAMQDAGVAFRLQNRMLAIFAPMRSDVSYQ